MRNRKHDIEKYLRGELSSAEMHALEKEALSDPFLAEALEGVEQTGADNFLYDLHKLNRSVHDRMRRKGRKNNKVIRLWGWTAAVAATLLLLAVSGFIAVSLLRDQHARDQAMSKPTISPADTTVQEEDSLAVTSGDDIPQAGLEEKQKSSAPTGAAPPSRKQEQQSIAEATPEPDEVDARQEVTPAQEFLADEESSRGAGGPADNVTNAETDDVSGQAESAVSRRAEQKEAEISKALQGQAAGVGTKDAKKRSQPATTQRSPTGPTVVKGQVRTQDGLGLPGVNVFVEGTSNGTVTDVEGNFQLTVPEENTRLQFAFIGFEPKVVDVTERAELEVILEEDVTSLSEVVVTGYSAESVPTDAAPFRFAEPDGGRADFKEYLASAVKYPAQAITSKVEGKVTVRFTVEPSGQLTDFEVVRGIGSGCEQEVIRAIREGPSWQPSKRGSQPLRDKVSVRYRFKLPE